MTFALRVTPEAQFELLSGKSKSIRTKKLTRRGVNAEILFDGIDVHVLTDKNGRVNSMTLDVVHKGKKVAGIDTTGEMDFGLLGEHTVTLTLREIRGASIPLKIR